MMTLMVLIAPIVLIALIALMAPTDVCEVTGAIWTDLKCHLTRTLESM